MGDDIVTRLGCAFPRHGTTDCELCTFCLAKAEIERLRAVLNAIDALPDKCPDEPYDGYDDFGIGKGLGWEQAMKRVKALLHPEEADRG